MRRRPIRPVEPWEEGKDERVCADAIAAADQRMDILEALQTLPAIHREVLTLFYFEDMPVADMALALEVTPGTVLSRLGPARAMPCASACNPKQPAPRPSPRPGCSTFPVAARGGRDD